MHRILYSSTVKAFDDYCVDVIQNYKSDIKSDLIAMMKRIYKDKRPNYRLYAGYVQCIINYFDQILKLKMEDFNTFIKDHLSFYTVDLSSNKWFKAKRNDVYKGSFYKTLVNKMRYNSVRKNEYINAINEIGIRTCVYCNAEYTPIYTSNGKCKARFEADHFYSKDKYPFLCISFYNLLPCCPYCNKTKNKYPSFFYLYTNDYRKLSPFQFSLEKNSIIDYKRNYDASKLKICIDCNEAGLLKNHNDRFHIENLYSSFKNEAEEILWKAMTRNRSYMEQLKASYSYIFGSFDVDQIRFLYGFYKKRSDIHKRPLTKMKQDIAKQLKILK